MNVMLDQNNPQSELFELFLEKSSAKKLGIVINYCGYEFLESFL
jgi:hypothetical protein